MDVVIVGAGMAGLTCGCLLARKGLKVLVVEKNPKVGGCCTSFEKEGFSFDLSVQSIGECRAGGRVWNLLKELGILHDMEFIPLEPAREYHFPDMKVLQSSRLETHIENLSRLFPDEREGIKKVYETLRSIFEEYSRIPVSLDLSEMRTFPSAYPTLFEFKDKTYQELLDQWVSHPRLKNLLSIRSSYALLPPGAISVIGMAGIEMSYFLHGVSCIRGKVETLPRKLGEALRSFGGQILLNNEVDGILLEDKKVRGIRLKQGGELEGRIVVSNIDACSTFNTLVNGETASGFLRSKLKSLSPTLSYFIVYLGIEGSVEGLSNSNNEVFFNDQLSEEYAFLSRNRISEEAPFYLLIPSMVNRTHAPPGTSTLCLSYKAPYSLAPEWSQTTKDHLTQRLIQKASAWIPNLEKRILVKAETTPRTIEKWTGNRLGAAYGWAQTPRQSGIYRLQRSTPIPNLFLTGHWTAPGGGISGVIASGELTAQLILKKLDQGA